MSTAPGIARRHRRVSFRTSLEESHEVVDAIRSGRDEDLEGELGDLLLNLAFQIVLGEERQAFTPFRCQGGWRRR